MIDIFGAAQDRDLGAVTMISDAQIAALEGKLPKGTHIVVRGQVQTMTASTRGLAIGFAGAIVLVYLLIVDQLPVVAGSLHHHHGPAGGASPALPGCC